MLRGSVVCSTNLTVTERVPFTLQSILTAKENCIRYVKELGGVFHPNFTHDVTHLVSTIVGTDKYKVAARIGIPIVTLAWLQTMSIQKQLLSTSDYQLLPFTGQTICVTGLDLTLRTQIQQKVEQGGGRYTSDLLKSCTHLIAKDTVSQKHAFAVLWSIQVVSVDWLLDSSLIGACMDPADYTVGVQPARIGAGEFLSYVNVYVSSAGRSSEATQKVKHLIVEAGGTLCDEFETTVVHYIIIDELPGEKEKSMFRQQSRKLPLIHSNWIKESVSKSRFTPFYPFILSNMQTRILAAESQSTEKSGLPRDSMEPMQTVRIKQKAVFEFDSILDTLVAPAVYSKAGLFDGLRFTTDGFNRDQVNLLKDEIESVGGLFVNSLNQADHIVCPIVMKPLTTNLPKRVTDFWIERCIDESILFSPSSEITFTPLDTSLFSFAPSTKFCLSGFDGNQREHITATLEALKATVTSHFKRDNTYLVWAKSGNDAKVRKAEEWGVPVVSLQWILECYQKRQVVKISGVKEKASNETRLTSGDQQRNQPTHIQYQKTQRSVITISDDESAIKFDTEDALAILESTQPTTKHSFTSSSTTSIPQTSDVGARGSFYGLRTDFTDASNTRNASVVSKTQPQASEILTTKLPFHDIMVCISLKLESRKPELARMVEELGGKVLVGLSKQATHFIYESSKMSHASRELASAKAFGCAVVSPHWLVNSFEQNKRLNEVDFPSSYSAETSQNSASMKRKSTAGKDTSPLAKRVNTSINRILSAVKEAVVDIDDVDNHQSVHIQKTTARQETSVEDPVNSGISQKINDYILQSSKTQKVNVALAHLSPDKHARPRVPEVNKEAYYIQPLEIKAHKQILKAMGSKQEF